MAALQSGFFLKLIIRPTGKRFQIGVSTLSRRFSSDNSKFYTTMVKTQNKVQSLVDNASSNVLSPSTVNATNKFAALDNRSALSKLGPKRPQRKVRTETLPNIWAYSTAERYDFGALRQFFHSKTSAGQQQYYLKPVAYELTDQVLRLARLSSAAFKEPGDLKYDLLPTASEIYVFRDGAVVLWNIAEKDRHEFFTHFLPRFEIGSFDRRSVLNEAEQLTYAYNDGIATSHFGPDETLHLKAFVDEDEDFLSRYAISDAMSRSVKLANRENVLSQFVDTLNPIVEDLKCGQIRVGKHDLLKKTGHLFALRHSISLDSDILDSLPDFYWDRDSAEKLYTQTSRIFCLQNRTKVINEKLNYCLQLGERLDQHLNATHSVRLERIIIFLIAIEVAFEMLPYVFDYFYSVNSRRSNDVTVD